LLKNSAFFRLTFKTGWCIVRIKKQTFAQNQGTIPFCGLLFGLRTEYNAQTGGFCDEES
jgi:hypothetical protein